MRTTSRKAISILLSIVMALTILPLSVFATGEDTTSSVTDLTTPVEPEKVSDVYQIGTTNELYWYANTINATQSPSSDDFKAILTADINFNPGVTFEYQEESGCLAGSGLRKCDNIIAVTQQKRYNFLLNRHRMFEAEFLDGAANLFAYAQFFKCLQCKNVVSLKLASQRLRKAA